MKEPYARALVGLWKLDYKILYDLSLTALAIGDKGSLEAAWEHIGVKSLGHNPRAKRFIAKFFPFASDALWDGKEELAVRLLMKVPPLSLKEAHAMRSGDRNERRREGNRLRATKSVRVRELGRCSDWKKVK